MKMYGGVEVQRHMFSTSTLDGSEWSASRPGRFPPMETAPGTHWLGGPQSRSGYGVEDKITSPAEIRTPIIRSPSL